MGNGSLTGVRVCVFDAYGTLFDFAAGQNEHRVGSPPHQSSSNLFQTHRKLASNFQKPQSFQR